MVHVLFAGTREVDCALQPLLTQSSRPSMLAMFTHHLAALHNRGVAEERRSAVRSRDFGSLTVIIHTIDILPKPDNLCEFKTSSQSQLNPKMT